ncbi:MAG: alpha/beta hydrolase [Anaerolineae bacterium]|nr:alpha/beta hydrolase [Anaerolineae bacterium]MDQ7036127.1 alpha/beta hydrolase [Anaerolineae bacterium]
MVEVIIVDSAEQNKSPRHIRWRWIILAIVLLLLLAVGGFVLWVSTPVGDLMPEALTALESDEQVNVTQRGWIAFVPLNAPPTAGIVFYPGLRIQAEAYAPLARRIAEEGYLATIVYAPLNLAIFDSDAAKAVIENFSAVDTWVVGGHSFGATVAARFVTDNLAIVDGLFFMAAAPSGDALASTNMPIMLLYGTNDGRASVDNILQSEANLPSTARFMAIEGGSHSQFAYYGLQSGDNEATISHDEQMTQTAAALIALLDSLTR